MDKDTFTGIKYVIDRLNKNNESSSYMINVVIILGIIIIVMGMYIFMLHNGQQNLVDSVINNVTFKNYLDILIDRRVKGKIRGYSQSTINDVDEIVSDAITNYSRGGTNKKSKFNNGNRKMYRNLNYREGSSNSYMDEYDYYEQT